MQRDCHYNHREGSSRDAIAAVTTGEKISRDAIAAVTTEKIVLVTRLPLQQNKFVDFDTFATSTTGINW